jgi:hypothetical protein
MNTQTHLNVTNRRRFLNAILVMASWAVFRKYPSDALAAECPSMPYGAGPYGQACYSGATVFISVTGPQTECEIAQRGLFLRVKSAVSGLVRLEQSQDLKTWTTARDKIPVEGGVWVDILAPPSTSPNKCYRARLLP